LRSEFATGARDPDLERPGAPFARLLGVEAGEGVTIEREVVPAPDSLRVPKIPSVQVTHSLGII